MINLIIIHKPANQHGEFNTSYEGKNRKIINSTNKLTHQRIVFSEKQIINGGIETICCFEIQLLNRKFLIVLDYEKLYEIIEDNDTKIYILLTESWFYILRSFVDGKKYITHGSLNLHYEYNNQAEYIENFDFQLNMRNEAPVLEWFSKITFGGEV